MSELSFAGQTVVVTGAGGGLGKAYATFFAARGANVVVNDLGGSFKGDGGASSKAADIVVEEIKKSGGKAAANYDSVENGESIIKTAIDNFGRVDIVINNAGILRDVSFKNITDKDWDLINAVHVRGAYKVTRAAWPYFKKQKYGRVINTASGAGLFGNFGQTNYSAAKLAQVGFTETLAKEGIKYNILVNCIAPIAASRMTETIMPPDLLKALGPEWVVPLVAVLVHSSNKTESGSIFDCGGGHISKIRWQRAKGSLLKCDDTYTAGAVLADWENVKDYKEAEYPTGPVNFLEKLEQSKTTKPNPAPKEIKGIKGKVALITGAGAGLGRAYALLFASMGAKVVVNDLVNPDTVVEEIRKAGGEAVGNKANVLDGAAVVKTAIDTYGRVDILINNAGILRDKAFGNMTDQMWDIVMDVHARGTYAVTKAAWPYMIKNKYGRIVNTTSTSGIYGNFGQANYAAAKCAILGFSRALGWEGVKNNIYVNTIAPNAGTQLTATVMPEEMVQAFKPHYVAPIVALLVSDSCPDSTLGLYEVGSGWQAQTRWQRSGGHGFPVDTKLTPEEVLKNWGRIIDFDDGRADSPKSMQDSMAPKIANFQNRNKSGKKAKSVDGPAVLAAIEKAKTAKGAGTEFVYTEKDVILYNLGIGAKRTELPFVYENNDDFQVIPSFGVIPPFNAEPPFSFNEILPNFSPMMLLHGEQYLEIKQWPIPTEGTLVSTVGLVDVVDKGNAGIVVQKTSTVDKSTGKELFYNESTVFVRGSGGFGGERAMKDRGPATAANKPPGRPADKITEEKTTDEQAAIYRLSGDRNPLHIDPEFSKVGGFDVPILHGLAFFGIAVKHILKAYGPIKNVKVRFAGSVLPGQTLKTEMWKEGNKVVFQVTVVDTGKLAIAGGGAELLGGGAAKL